LVWNLSSNRYDEDALNALVPLPPLNEQKRIVQKIDEIFEMIPQLEEAFEKRTKYKRQLNRTSLNRLTDAKSKE
jgi:type I restriction enzyme, S subunit